MSTHKHDHPLLEASAHGRDRGDVGDGERGELLRARLQDALLQQTVTIAQRAAFKNGHFSQNSQIGNRPSEF